MNWIRFLSDHRGFTLVELIVTIVVAGVLLTIAVPSFHDVIKNTRLTTDTNDLVSSLTVARSEAVKRAVPVTVCRSSNSGVADVPGTPVPSCTTTSSGWESGWIVFIDDGGGVAANAGNGVRDANETLVKIHDGLNANITLRTGTNFQNYLTYQANGTCQGSSGLANDTFRLCDDRGTAKAYSIVINQVGRVRSQRTTTSCP